MSAIAAPTLQLFAWIAERPRTYPEAIEARELVPAADRVGGQGGVEQSPACGRSPGSVVTPDTRRTIRSRCSRPAKSRASVREVPLVDRAYALLAQRREEQAKGLGTEGDFVFTSATGR